MRTFRDKGHGFLQPYSLPVRHTCHSHRKSIPSLSQYAFPVPLTTWLSECFLANLTVLHMLCVDDSVIPLTVNFQVERSGRYMCRIILRGGERAGNQLSAGDVRVFQIRCVVSPQGNRATIDFVSPVSIPVVQNIPIVSCFFSGGTVYAKMHCCLAFPQALYCIKNCHCM